MMPKNNRFCHQQYPAKPAISPSFHRLRHRDADEVDFSRLHTGLGVSHVILVPGTFMGDDSFAIAEVLEAIGDDAGLLQQPIRAAASALRQRTQQFTQNLTADVGNYTAAFEARFQELVGESPSVVRLQPPWSGQNHHVARADLAVRLFNRIIEIDPREGESILLWGHSHAGNGFALLTNLLANDRESVKQFLDTAGEKIPDHWSRVKEILEGIDGRHPAAEFVDIVTFGTPVRYGWDTSGCASLLHVSHHVAESADDPLRAHPVFPFQSLPDVLGARYGDWVQTFGIAGTDAAAITVLSQYAALERFLEGSLSEPEYELDTRFIPSVKLRNLCARWKAGARCHADGQNLLVTYEPCGRKTRLAFPVEQSMLGHGVATVVDWLPAHLALVVSNLPSSAGLPD